MEYVLIVRKTQKDKFLKSQLDMPLEILLFTVKSISYKFWKTGMLFSL